MSAVVCGHSAGAAPVSGLRALAMGPRWLHDQVGCLIDLMSWRREIIPFQMTLRRRPRRRWYVFALGPGANRAVLSQPDVFRPGGQVLRGPDGSSQQRLRFGLTRMHGAKHLAHRKVLTPPLQKPAVVSYYPAMVNIVERELGSLPHGRPINGVELVRRVTLGAASHILFGGEDPKRAFQLGELLKAWLLRNFKLGSVGFQVRCPFTPYARLLSKAEEIETEITSLIADKRATGCPLHSDILSRLIEARDRGVPHIDEDDLLGQAAILFGASYETTESAMVWALLLVAQHPAVAHDLLDEIRAVVQDRPPTAADLDRMPLLTSVIDESLRILPPVPSNMRMALEPTRLGEYELEPGDRVICSHYVTHHLPELYPDPERFRPARWLERRPGPFDYIPFSAGPRFCLGYHFALAELKVILVMVLQRYCFSLVENCRIDRVVRVTMRPRRGLPIVLHPPDRDFRKVPVRGNINQMVHFEG